MSKHTEGPWFITGRMTKYIEARLPGGLIQEVAACGPTDADGGYGEQQQANANLIAAAPNLLEACEAHIAALGSKIRDGEDRPEYREAIYQAYKKIVAAISKARGEA